MSKIHQRTAIQGFTLVELSIVIIIIGFLIAGIAAGTSLIKQAELNSVITDFRNYQVAYNNFLSRYNKIPGDFNAGSTNFTSCDSTASWPAGETACNGNGNGLIDTYHEVLLAWKHLSLANMIAAGIIQIPNTFTSNAVTPVAGQNLPSSKANGGADVYMMAVGADATIGSGGGGHFSGLWNNGQTNAVFVSKIGSNVIVNAGGLKVEDAFNLDRKVDDASLGGGTALGANSGAVRAFEDPLATATACLSSATTYNVSGTNNSAIACVSAQALN